MIHTHTHTNVIMAPCTHPGRKRLFCLITKIENTSCCTIDSCCDYKVVYRSTAVAILVQLVSKPREVNRMSNLPNTIPLADPMSPEPTPFVARVPIRRPWSYLGTNHIVIPSVVRGCHRSNKFVRSHLIPKPNSGDSTMIHIIRKTMSSEFLPHLADNNDEYYHSLYKRYAQLWSKRWSGLAFFDNRRFPQFFT